MGQRRISHLHVIWPRPLDLGTRWLANWKIWGQWVEAITGAVGGNQRLYQRRNSRSSPAKHGKRLCNDQSFAGHVFSSTKPEAASPARPGKGVGEALAVTPFESYELDYMNPPDLEEWFQREGVLSVEDEIKRAKEHSCFAVFLSKEILEAEEDWVFGGDDAYADLETFMYYVREWKARNEDWWFQFRSQVCAPPLKTFVKTYCTVLHVLSLRSSLLISK